MICIGKVEIVSVIRDVQTTHHPRQHNVSHIVSRSFVIKGLCLIYAMNVVKLEWHEWVS